MANYEVDVANKESGYATTVKMRANNEDHARVQAFESGWIVSDVREIDPAVPTGIDGKPLDPQFVLMRDAVFWGIMKAWIWICIITAILLFIVWVLIQNS